MALPYAQTAVIIRTVDRPLFLKRALESLAAQRHRDWLAVVVNDGGEPEAVERTVTEAGEALSGHVHLLHIETSKGRKHAANRGVAACDSRFVTLLDDDDSWDPAFLERCVGYLTRYDDARLGGVATQSMRLRERLEDGVPLIEAREPANPDLTSLTLDRFFDENPIQVNSFVYKRSAYDAIGRYDETIPLCGDWDFNLRFIARFDIHVIPEPLANYHFRVGASGAAANSVSGDGRAYFLNMRAAIKNKYIRAHLENGGHSLADYVAAHLLVQGAVNDSPVLRDFEDRVVYRLLLSLKKLPGMQWALKARRAWRK